jgi:uncharacterized protein YecE (DUF72 family)
MRYLLGTGGWAYFRIPSMRALTAYSNVFDFVEVNSTFYEIPTIQTVQSWRRMVPNNFEFTVRCNRLVTHRHEFKPTPETYTVFKTMIEICKTLNAEVLHLQTPPTYKPTKNGVEIIRDFLSSIDPRGIRLALELRNRKRPLNLKLIKIMEDYDIIHCIDLSREEIPAYNSDILYTRIFGKGPHNIYQPTDEDLREVDTQVTRGSHEIAFVNFHSMRMYKDAARLKIFKKTNSFPMVTNSTGLDSLKEVLREDAKFPSSRRTLIHDQGWKLIDLKEDERVQASVILKKLPEKRYHSLEEVVKELQLMK